MPAPHDCASSLVESELHDLLRRLEGEFSADCLAFIGPLHFRADDLLRDILEPRENKQGRLVVILESDGGYIEVVERMVRVLRQHYSRVEFVVPNYAMSAGTVLVMSGDAIHMDYYSVLGPIDPQLPKRGGNGMVPALGYLAEYYRLIKKSHSTGLSAAEIAYLVDRFDPAELHDYKQARNLSISLLKEWLVKYKFKDWSVTEGSKMRVTQEMKETRAEDIARSLNRTTRWRSHGRGIPMALIEEELKLKIEDMGRNPERHRSVRKYHSLLKDYMGNLDQEFVLHIPGTYTCV